MILEIRSECWGLILRYEEGYPGYLHVFNGGGNGDERYTVEAVCNDVGFIFERGDRQRNQESEGEEIPLWEREDGFSD